jgi:glycosyltransferase involved in cell wall biosynthesis
LNRTLRILGTRGVPAAHGGFETFAEHLALYLVRHGWRVIVYCQNAGTGPIVEDVWEGIERVIISVPQPNPRGNIFFDWKATRHASNHGDLCLTLGYNTAVFCAWLRLRGVPNLINMDGIEWRRAKWGTIAKSWLWLNDWAGCWLGNHLVADHPDIARHLQRRVSGRKITMIPYGAPQLEHADGAVVRQLGLEPGRYMTLIARAEPENSILEIVQGFSERPRGVKLVVLGTYEPSHEYQAAVKAAASDEVIFVGAIYDKTVVQALRLHSLAYLHGHQVGGTNPSLVEALGAGNAIIAHDNRFNRWVAGPGARYFASAAEVSRELDQILGDASVLTRMRTASQERFQSEFRWDDVLAQYAELLERWLPAGQPAAMVRPRG